MVNIDNKIQVDEIDKKIALLPEDRQKEFSDRVLDICYDRGWFLEHHMNYADPNVQRIKEILYEEKYAQFSPE